MNSIVAAWRRFTYGRRFVKLGEGVRFLGSHIQVEGHVEMGKFGRVRDHVVLRTRDEGRIILGARVILSYYALVEASQLVQIGDNAGIAAFVTIHDSSHAIRGTDANYHDTPLIRRPIVIGNGAWIGSHAYIGPGVTIGDGAVVGACSVVNEDIGPYEVWGGVPARFLYHRTKDVPPDIQAELDRLIAEGSFRGNLYEDA